MSHDHGPRVALSTSIINRGLGMDLHLMRSIIAVSGIVAIAGCQNSETAKGDVNKAKGQVEQAAGNVVGSDSLKSAGKADETKGKVQKTVGNVEHAVNP